MEGGDDFIGFVGDGALRQAGGVREDQSNAVAIFPDVHDLGVDGAGDD